MSIPKEAAEAALGPENLDRLRRCVAGAVDGYFKSLSPDQRADLGPRTRASAIHDFMRREAERTFAMIPRVACLDVRGLFVLNFDDRVVVRFKKLEADLRSRGLETQQSLGFVEQGELEGIPAGVPHLEAGYVLNGLQTGYASIYLVCPDGLRSNRWTMELHAPEAVAEIRTLERNESNDAKQTRRFRSKFRTDRAEDGEPSS